jgi:predicted dehydrogenase
MLLEDGKSLERTMYRAVIIGCGKIAGEFDSPKSDFIYSHSHAYSTNPFVEVVCYVDTYIEKAKNLSNLYSSNEYSDNFVEALKKWKPEIVSICTPSQTHFSITKQVLDLDLGVKIIFLEKPVCSNIDELKKLEYLSNSMNIPIIVNHSRRFHPKLKYIKDKIAEDHFGEIIRTDIFYYGGWENNGTHVIDTLVFLFGKKLQIEKIIEVQKSKYIGDPTVGLKLKFFGKSAPIYLNAFDESNYQIFEFDLKFDRCRLRVENFETRFLLERKIYNSLQENILVLDKMPEFEDKSSPMEIAVSILTNYLKNENIETLKPYMLESVGQSMKIIWSVREMLRVK